MMKTGISFHPHGNGYARFGKEKFFKIAEHGFSAIDYNMADTETELYTWSDSELEKRMLSEKEAAARAGLLISQVHGPWRFPPQDHTAEHRQERLEKMKKSITATRILGCSYWVVHPIMPCGIEDLLQSDAPPMTWELNLAFLSELLDFAKTQGVTICLENMPMRNFSLASPVQILKFVQTMHDEHFKICLDTGHVAISPDLSVGNVVRTLRDEIRVLHIHDNHGDRDAHLYPTYGIIDWTDFVCALEEIGFPGVFSLETAPSEALDDLYFEIEGKKLFEIARTLLNHHP